MRNNAPGTTLARFFTILVLAALTLLDGWPALPRGGGRESVGGGRRQSDAVRRLQ